jgi:hypothetical protein
MRSTSKNMTPEINRVLHVGFMAIVLLTFGGRMEAQTIRLVWSGVNAGGARSASSNTHMIASVGQSAVATGVAGNLALKSGFLAAPVLLGPLTGISAEPESGLPAEYLLNQNYPNPFNPSTTISYHLPVQSHVSLKVYDVLGREVATLADEVQEAGSMSVVLDADRLASGAYFYRLQAAPTGGGRSAGIVATRKLLLMK